MAYKDKEEKIAYNKAYYEANKEEYLAKCKVYRETNKEWLAVNAKAWREANKGRAAALSAGYKARKLKLIPIHLRDCPQERQRLIQTYKLRNIISKATGVQHHVDHMWPLADGGPHWSGNLQVITAYENLSKNASVCEATKSTIIKSLESFQSERTI